MIRAALLLLSLLCAAGLALTPWLRPLDTTLLDAQFRILREHALRPVGNDVVVVGFDETSMSVLREPFALWHPHLGAFLEAAAQGGATAIGVDVVLPDRSHDNIVPGLDRKLLTGIVTARRAAPLVLAVTVDGSGATRPIHPPFVTAAGDGGAGYALLPIDRDGVVRRFHERLDTDGRAVPTLVGQHARSLGRAVPREGLIDFAAGAPFDFVPLERVLEWRDAGDVASLQRAFGGRPVLLGSVLGFDDRHATPVRLVGWDVQAVNTPGVLLHAQALRNLLNDGLVRPVARWLPLLLALAAGMLWMGGLSPAAAVALLVAVWTACIAASTVALARGFELPVARVMSVALLALGARQIFEGAARLRERQRLRGAFGGYVSPVVMRQILAGAIDPGLGGTRQFGCVLFSDIRGFTTRSEHMTPEQTIAFLNRYFERIVPIIHDHGGTVISFMGDGIMAVFGVPQPLPDPCAAAFDASRAILSHLRILNADFARKGEAPLDIGIGLHAGEGLAGHVGAAMRHDYTLIGDVTNVASRLEGVTKEVSYHLVCSRAVADRLGDAANLVPLGFHAIKGHTALEIFGHDPVARTSATAPA